MSSLPWWCLCCSLASLILLVELHRAAGFAPRDASMQVRRIQRLHRQHPSVGASSSTSLLVGYSPPSSSGPYVVVADALQTMWRRQVHQSTTSSSLLLPPRTKNSTAEESNAYLDQATVSGVWTPRAPSSRSTVTFEATSTRTATASRQFQLFVDLDGVLCDFEHGVRSIFPEMTESMSLQDLERHDMWKRISSQSSFFRNLPWARGGQELWDAVRHLEPDILTGVPASFAASRIEKFDWCARELFGVQDDEDDDARTNRKMRRQRRHQGGVVEHVDMAGQFFQHARVNESPSFLPTAFLRKRSSTSRRHLSGSVVVRKQRVITCWSSNKHHESRPGAVLIDDCLRLRDDWESKGGIFIHHKTGDVDRTLQQLFDHGILTDPQ